MSRPLSFWKRVQYHTEYRAVVALVRVCSAVPLSLLRPAGAVLGWIAFRLLRIRRRVVLDNLDASLGADAVALRKIAERSYMNYGRCLMEMAAFRTITPEALFDMVEIEGTAHLDDALAFGRGAIIFSGHLGNWELLGAVIARRGYPLHVTDTNHSNKRVHSVISALRRAQGMQLIAPGRPVKYLLRLLERNRFIAYLADQNAGRTGIFVDFFGRPASTLRGPALFSVRRGCPVVPAFIARVGSGRHRIVIESPLWPDTTLSREEAVHELTQRFTRVLETYVRRHPDEYFWMHRRWKTRPVPDGKATARSGGGARRRVEVPGPQIP